MILQPSQGQRDLPSSSLVLPLDEEDDIGIRQSSSVLKTRRAISLGRLINTLLDADLKVLIKVTAVLKSGRRPSGSVAEAVLVLLSDLRSTDASDFLVERVLIPVLEHAVKSKDFNYRKRAACILQMLLESEEVGAKASAYTSQILSGIQTSNRVKLGWCIVIREIVQRWSADSSSRRALSSSAFQKIVMCLPVLEITVRSSSVKEGNRKIPTRLAIVAADCFLEITKAVASVDMGEDDSFKNELQGRKTLITPITSSPSKTTDRTSGNNNENLFLNSGTRNMALWKHLDSLIVMVNELHEWNYGSRPLYAKGLERLQKRLLSLAQFRDSLEDHATKGDDISVGAEVLVASWKHFVGLVMIQEKSFSINPEPVVQHWLGALQFFAQENDSVDGEEDARRRQEMKEYALACMAMTLGRLDAPRLETILQVLEPELLNVLFSQLRGGDSATVELAVWNLRSLLFRTPILAADSPESTASRIETIMPMLIDMLDTRDMAARAVVLLVAEYFAANMEASEFEKLFTRLDSEDPLQRRNALDVLTELFAICTRNSSTLNSSLSDDSQTFAAQLFKRLGDTELTNRAETSALFASLDPSFTVPSLVGLIYAPDARVRSAASAALLSVLKGKTDHWRVIVELLDSVRNFLKEKEADSAKKRRVVNSGENTATAPIDLDRVMRLVQKWASQADDWGRIIPSLLQKMFAEPANPVIPRFLSSISQQLAENRKHLFPAILTKFQEQLRLTEASITKISEQNTEAVANCLFDRLSPLLVLRVLPLSAFDDTNSQELYDSFDLAAGGVKRKLQDCIAQHVLDRTCGAFEFEDVRKVASEITGRLPPEIMLPRISAQLEDAVSCQDIPRLKACLYAICTSLVARATKVITHKLMEPIRRTLSSVLLWPCMTEDRVISEIAKAQHGCIDCLALMICAETQVAVGEEAVGDSLQIEETVKVLETSNTGEEDQGVDQRYVLPDLTSTGSVQQSRDELKLPGMQIKRVDDNNSAEAVSFQEDGPFRVHEGIQLIEKLPESEQLRQLPSVHDKSVLDRGVSHADTLKEKLSNSKVQARNRLSDVGQEPSSNRKVLHVASESEASGRDVRESNAIQHVATEDGTLISREMQGKINSNPLIVELSDLDLGRRVLKDEKKTVRDSQVLAAVVSCLTSDNKKLPSWFPSNGNRGAGLVGGLSVTSVRVPATYRVCMANVLISASQKVPLAGRPFLAERIVPPLVIFAQSGVDSRLKAACLQVLFTSVYHLQGSAMLPFAGDLMNLALNVLKSRAPFEERLAGAKLLASLLGSEEVLVRELAPQLLDAQVALSSISAIDSSQELRVLCEKLLSCLSTVGDSDV